MRVIMSLVPTAIAPEVTISVTSLETAYTANTTPSRDHQAVTTTPSKQKNTTELLTVTASPVSTIRIYTRTSPKSPFTPSVVSAAHSPLASNHTEPRFKVISPAKSPVKISAIGSSLVNKLKEAAESGDVEAQFNLAMSYSFGDGVEQNFEKALSLFLKSANQGDARAQYYLGVMYSNGHGTSTDLDQAFKWFSKSAIQGDADAQCELGMMYLQGRGVEKNEKEAFENFLKSAEQGQADAQNNLAVSYEAGEGVEKDVSQAAIWYRKAAEQGDADAQIQIERLFAEGLSTEKDKQDTLQWYQQAAKQNMKFAQKALIHAFSTGQGVAQDLHMATYWVVRSSLEQGISIKVNQENFDLIKFIPGILIKFPEFSKVKKVEFENGYLSNENFSSIAKLIELNSSINLIILSDNVLENADGLKIIQALQVNTELTDLFFDGSHIHQGIRKEIQKLLDQNIAIAEVRQYAKNYAMHTSKNITKELLLKSLDEIIISSIKSGQSIGVAMQTVDTFLSQSSKAPKAYTSNQSS